MAKHDPRLQSGCSSYDVGSFRAGGHIHSPLFHKDCWEGDQIVMERFYYSEMITNGQTSCEL